MPAQSGHHTRVNIASTISDTLSSFGITGDRIGWFVADNASNNDTCIETLTTGLDLDFNPAERRIRCAGHILNLVAHSVLFSRDEGALESSECDTLSNDVLAVGLPTGARKAQLRRSTTLFDGFECHLSTDNV